MTTTFVVPDNSDLDSDGSLSSSDFSDIEFPKLTSDDEHEPEESSTVAGGGRPVRQEKSALLTEFTHDLLKKIQIPDKG